MTTTVATTVVMQSSQRGEGSKKQQSRLPAIAPKDDVSSSASSSRSRSAKAPSTGGPGPSRTRLPPRSRTGCWTCRTRKVKCDEGRPVCGQCLRLGHTCDYNPRLSFRDDTQRIVDRMQDVSILASPVWDPSSPLSIDGLRSPVDCDDPLPPFALLNSDEDRERKAEAQAPGTYHVVINPESFAHLPEYTDEVVESPALLPRRGSIAHSLTSSAGRDLSVGEVVATDDPNTVLVRRFEDFSRRPANTSREYRLSATPVLRKAQTASDDEYGGRLVGLFPQSTNNLINAASERDRTLLQHFRERIWPQLAQLDSARAETDAPEFPGEDTIEEVAAVFSPCYHALMAVAATTLAHQNGEQRLDALQHHQQVLTALQSNLRSTDDLTSDGTFLTHFLLLIYEIVAAETEGSNLWSQQVTQLLQISLMRREALGGERYPFIVWWTCNIDLQALFSGAGTGGFIEMMMKNDIMPPPSFHMCPLGPDGSSIIYPEEGDTLPAILQLNYEVTILAGRLGLLGREFRAETLDVGTYAGDLSTGPSTPVHDIKFRQRRILELQDSLRQLWTSPNIQHLRTSVDILSSRPRRVFEHAVVLFRACLIYSHTSMWSGQRLDTGAEYEEEIGISVQEILQIAEGIVNGAVPQVECRFIVFPVFLAGVSSTNGAEKMMALDLIGRMEEGSIGSNTKATREVLQMVYERQTRRFMSVGHSLDVNWMAVMTERGSSIVSFGL